jgi:hypothetical protein
VSRQPGDRVKFRPSLSISLAVTVALELILNVLMMAQPAHAGTLSNTYVRLNRMKSGTGSSIRIVFTTVASGATSVVLNMNGTDSGVAQWTNATPGGLVNSSQTVSSATCNAETGATALPGSITAAGSGPSITISSVTALSATTAYCVDLTSATAVTNPTAGHEGEYHPTLTVGSDSTNVAVRVIANDQVTTTATVPPTFNFVLSANTDNFSANLSTSSLIYTSGVTATLTTNAASGWTMWTKGTNVASGDSPKGALKSTAAGNRTIPQTEATALGAASFAPTTGQEHYGLGATITTDAANGGTVSLDTAYDSSGFTKIGVIDTSIYRRVASSNGAANGDVITFKEGATISGLTPAANDYTDTLTMIAAGTF